MLSKLLQKLKYLVLIIQNEGKDESAAPYFPVSKHLFKNLDAIRQLFGQSADVIIRQFNINSDKNRVFAAAIIYIDGLVDKARIDEGVLRPLMTYCLNAKLNTSSSSITEALKSVLATADEIRAVGNLYEGVDAVLSGSTALFIEGFKEALLIEIKSLPSRAIEKPDTEGVVRGPKEGFTENLRINTSLLRCIIRDPNLTFIHMRLGKRTKTCVVIAYIRGLTSESLIAEIKRRLKKIEADAILESGYIEQFIEDHPFSLFSTIGNSEKPDKISAKLLEGRAAIFVEGTPVVLTVPYLFIEGFQNTEDYYAKPYFASFMRWIRFLSFALSVLSPALYIAFVTFHQELIPTPLLITIAAAREGTPFPTVVEVILMIIVFEILREASVRMPRSLGQAVSIVGALVIGQAAVTAGLVGAPIVIVVALTAITTFIVPPMADAGTFLRLLLSIMAGAFGLFGVLIGLLGTLVHLASLSSFGVPYLSPVAPMKPGGMKDVFVRAPLWITSTRKGIKDLHDPEKQKSATLTKQSGYSKKPLPKRRRRSI